MPLTRYYTALSILFAGGTILAWMMVEFVSAKLEPPNEWHERFESNEIGLDPRPRYPLRNSVVGDAAGDYTRHRGPHVDFESLRNLFDADGKPRPLSPQEQAMISGRAGRRVIEAFARASEREYFGESVESLSWASKRLRLLFASAGRDIRAGDDKAAWRKLTSAIRYQQDVVGRTYAKPALREAAETGNYLAALTRMAARAHPTAVKQLRFEIRTLLLDQLPTTQVPSALLVGSLRMMRRHCMKDPNSRPYYRSLSELAHAYDNTNTSSEHAVPLCLVYLPIKWAHNECHAVREAAMYYDSLGAHLRQLSALLSVKSKGGSNAN